MKRSQILICAFLLIVVSACKTQEDVRREQTVQNLNEEIQQTKKTTANGNSRFNALEEQVSRLHGQLEEQSHNDAQNAATNKQLQDRLTTIEEFNKKQVEYIKALTEKVNNQSGYIEEVLEKLKTLSASSEKPASKKKEINPDNAPDAVSLDEPATFDNGMKKYRAKDYNGALEIFKQVAENKKAAKKNRDGATHYLGMIEYKNKNYEAAKVHFSKLFSESPNSTHAAETLLYLGKTFTQLKSKDEADMTFDELISQFPKSKEAAEAQKLKK